MTRLNDARKAQALSKLRRDVLSSQILVALDKKEGKPTPHEIELLSALNLPLFAAMPKAKRAEAAKKTNAAGNSPGSSRAAQAH